MLIAFKELERIYHAENNKWERNTAACTIQSMPREFKPRGPQILYQHFLFLFFFSFLYEKRRIGLLGNHFKGVRCGRKQRERCHASFIFCFFSHVILFFVRVNFHGKVEKKKKTSFSLEIEILWFSLILCIDATFSNYQYLLSANRFGIGIANSVRVRASLTRFLTNIFTTNFTFRSNPSYTELDINKEISGFFSYYFYCCNDIIVIRVSSSVIGTMCSYAYYYFLY